MKKFLALFVSLIMSVSLAACSKTGKYSVLEVKEYDNISGAKHRSEITLDVEEYTNRSASDKKTVRAGDTDWNVTYDSSKKGYLYKNNIDYYENSENGVSVQIGINKDTGIMDSYSWVDINYASDKNSPELDENACLDIAKAYLNDFIAASDYEVVNVRYLNIPEYKALYDFEFVRKIDGTNTSDKAYIGVSVFGDVVSHLFVSLGEMADAKLPTADEMQKIEENIYAKLDSIYKNVTEKYDISYEVSDKVLVRLADGKYAFEYYIDATLEAKDASAAKLTESTKLLIYID